MSLEIFLNQVPLFQTLNGSDRARLCSSIRSRQLARGEVLFRKESEGATLYIIRSGKIKIVLPSRDGDEVILAIFSQGDFFGEMALLDNMPRSADAVALEDSEVLLLDRPDFLTFLVDHKSAVQAILGALSRRLRKTDDLLQDTCFLNISARFAKKLLELAENHGTRDENGAWLDLGLTQRDFASMIGATRESINKELRVLREKGLVSTVGSRICIHDMQRLQRRVH